MSSLLLVIKKELKVRQWDYKTLGEESGLSRALISRVMSQSIEPSCDFVIKTAIALECNPVQWLQLANILPVNTNDVQEDDSTVNEISAVARALPPDKREKALSYLRYLLNE